MQPQFGVELKQLLMQIQAHEELGDLEARERAIISAVQFAKYMGFDAGFRPLGDADGKIVENPDFPIPEWAGKIVAYIVLPTGQVAYFMKKHKTEWDGHDRKTKLERIADFVYDRVRMDGIVVSATNEDDGARVLN
jgi:hypothetical protein